MAVLGRLLISSAERLDLPDLLSIDSYAAGDFKYLLKGLVNDVKPYILKGFDVIDPASAIGTQSCSIRIADSSVFYPGSKAGPFFYGLPAGDPNAQPLVPELRKNAVNYVYLTFTTFNTSADSRAFWDPDKDGGAGGEFTQDVNTESVLTCQVNVSVGAFPANTIPVAKITVGAVVITAIEDARDMMFRLGTGGINPDPYANYNWNSLPDSTYQRNEPPTTMVAGGVNPFEGADKNILSLKDWMDAIMTKLKELGGTTHWYDDVSTFSLINSFLDSSATVLQSKGLWVHSASIPGHISWTEDIHIKLATDPRDYVLSGPDFVQLQNGQVAYLNLIRSQPINGTDSLIAFTNGQSYINTVGGSVGLFANLSIGDYVRSSSDPNQNFNEVVQFYDSVNASGSITTPALAKSVRLAAVYNGPTLNNSARYDRGVYTAADVIVSDRDVAPLTTAGGNFFWLAYRSDNIETLTNIATTDLSITVNTNDGTKALVTSSTAHGLSDNQRVVIAGTTNYNGTYQVEVASTTTFYIPVTAVFSVPQSGTASYAIATTAANHGFPTDATINVTNTTNYNGAYQIATIDATHFQIPVPAGSSAPVGSPNLATAATYGILGASAVTNSVGTSTVNGDLGIYPGSSVTGAFTVTGATNIANTAAHTAQTDALAAYIAAAAHGGYVTIPSALDGQTLTAGYYSFLSGAATLATSGPGTLTLNGSATDLFVIKTASTLITGAGGTPTITLTGGALASNVYWIVGSSATINSGTAGTFVGTIIAQASITDTLGGTINGRLIALTGAVTLSQQATITLPSGGSTPPETTGTVTLAAVIVRTQQGAFTLYEGQSIPVNGTFVQGFPSFVGSTPDYAVPPGYNTLAGTENYNSAANDTVSVRLSKLTAMMADKAQDKTIKYLPTGLLLVSNTADGANQDITFNAGATLTILQPGSPGNAVITLPSASPGISLAANQSAYVVIDRNAASTPSIVIANTTAVPVDENVFVIAERLSGASIYLWDGAQFNIGTLPFAGSGTGIQKVDLYNPVNTSLPTGTVTIDGTSVTAGMLVLFSNLSSNNNEIYKAIGTGTNITSWTAQFAFTGSVSPSTGDIVIASQGQNYANQVGEFNGTTWLFNNTVRHFNGTDYWEQSAIITSTLADNTVNGTVFSVNYTGSENQIVDYSIVRGTLKETGSIYITTDGVNVSVAEGATSLNGVSGVTFSGSISGNLLLLQYTTTSTGVAVTMKYSVKRWSDSSGGPGGLPSYSGASGSGVTNVNGLAGAITLASGTNITITPSGNTLTIASTGGGGPTLQGPFTILDNQNSPVTLFSYVASTSLYAVFNYSILKNTSYRVGTLLVSNNGVITSESDDYVETGSSGVTLSAVYSGGSVNIQYTSTNTGASGTLKYYVTSWS